MISQVYRAGEFQGRLAAVAGAIQAGIPQALYRPLGLLFQADVRQQFYSGIGAGGIVFRPLSRPRPDGSDKPLMDKGLLAASYVAEVDAAGVTVASAHPAAALHQVGGRIVPVRAKALTLAVSVEARRYGSPRRFPRPLFSLRGYLVERVGTGRNAVIVRHYKFSQGETIPARPVGFTDEALSDGAEMIADYYLARMTG